MRQTMWQTRIRRQTVTAPDASSAIADEMVATGSGEARFRTRLIQADRG